MAQMKQVQVALPVQYIVVPSTKTIYLSSCCERCAVAKAHCAPVPVSRSSSCNKKPVQVFPRRRCKRELRTVPDSAVGTAEVVNLCGVWEKLPCEQSEAGGHFDPRQVPSDEHRFTALLRQACVKNGLPSHGGEDELLFRLQVFEERQEQIGQSRQGRHPQALHGQDAHVVSDEGGQSRGLGQGVGELPDEFMRAVHSARQFEDDDDDGGGYADPSQQWDDDYYSDAHDSYSSDALSDSYWDDVNGGSAFS